MIVVLGNTCITSDNNTFTDIYVENCYNVNIKMLVKIENLEMIDVIIGQFY